MNELIYTPEITLAIKYRKLNTKYYTIFVHKNQLTIYIHRYEENHYIHNRNKTIRDKLKE